MKQLLRKRELVEAINVPKSTVADWIIEFHMFIPTIKEGSVLYYRPAALAVLEEIKTLREQGFSKPEIMKELGRKFALTVDEADQEDMKKRIMGYEMLPKLLEQLKYAKANLEEHSELLHALKEHNDSQDEQIELQQLRIEDMQLKMELLQKELAFTKEQIQLQKRSWWRKIWSRSG